MSQLSYESLCESPSGRLEEIVRTQPAPAFESLAGWEFRGFNVMALTEVLRIRKFKKGFYADARDPSRLYGYNVRVEQNGRRRPWVPVLRHGQPLRHGLYDVTRVTAEGPDGLYPQSLLLDYGCGRNPTLDPSRFLRDYLVQAAPDEPDLLVGKAYIALGPVRVPGGYFVLERYNQVS